MTEFLELAWVQRTLFVLGGLFVGLVLERIVVYRARRLALRTRFKWDDLIVNSLHGVAAIWCVSGGELRGRGTRHDCGSRGVVRGSDSDDRRG